MTERVRDYDVLVIGAGPAGLAAAQAAAMHGVSVGLLDAQPRAGGQVWRHDVAKGATAAARRAFSVLAQANVDWLAQTQVVMAQPGWLLASRPEGALQLRYQRLILATGARELLLPFPGWTLPGVTGAGGAQALAKQGWPLQGRRVLVAGSGPLLLAAAATLRRHGAQLLGIHEQACSRALAAFTLHLARWPGKLAQAVALRASLAGVGYRSGSVVVAAHGDDRLREVEIEDQHGARRRIACEQLALGYGLVPNTELAQLLGCRLEYHGTHAQVAVDAQLRSSVEHIYAVGEAIGIGGRDCALVEGAMAGHLAAGDAAAATALQGRRRHARGFAELLQKYFALDQRIRTLAQADTVVCRCEDVTLRQLQGTADARDAKLSTRCGMGACQGRVCGSALAELGLSHPALSTDGGRRPPLFPVRLAALTDSFTDLQGTHR
jgi:NADPH-dependent 2,4-dienoyl-CoA reductase/sulfur reductase-like enzyme